MQLCSSENFLALPFFGIEMKTDLFQSCDHCWVFQICWHIECSTFTASSLRIWYSSAGIPLSSLVLFTVMIPKAHLTSPKKTINQKDTCTSMFITALFTITRICKQPKCPLPKAWIKKMWYIYIVKYYSVEYYSIKWRRKWQPTPVFLPGESHGQRSLAGYSS